MKTTGVEKTFERGGPGEYGKDQEGVEKRLRGKRTEKGPHRRLRVTGQSQ